MQEERVSRLQNELSDAKEELKQLRALNQIKDEVIMRLQGHNQALMFADETDFSQLVDKIGLSQRKAREEIQIANRPRFFNDVKIAEIEADFVYGFDSQSVSEGKKALFEGFTTTNTHIQAFKYARQTLEKKVGRLVQVSLAPNSIDVDAFKVDEGTHFIKYTIKRAVNTFTVLIFDVQSRLA